MVKSRTLQGSAVLLKLDLTGGLRLFLLMWVILLVDPVIETFAITVERQLRYKYIGDRVSYRTISMA